MYLEHNWRKTERGIQNEKYR